MPASALSEPFNELDKFKCISCLDVEVPCVVAFDNLELVETIVFLLDALESCAYAGVVLLEVPFGTVNLPLLLMGGNSVLERSDELLLSDSCGGTSLLNSFFFDLFELLLGVRLLKKLAIEFNPLLPFDLFSFCS